jgi:hypothetical protein
MAATADTDVANRFLKSVAEGDLYLTLSGDESEIPTGPTRSRPVHRPMSKSASLDA